MTEESQEIKSSFAIVVEPQFENGKWDGSVTAHMEEELNDDLGEDEIMQIRSVCGMMASTLTLMEADQEFYQYVSDYFFSNYRRMIEEYVEETNATTFTRSDDGKVITLHMNTKTHGEA
tara:strand:+ start:1592 stop:1948 length:357 start_codon:yes stop_codon:yes gene_type:complete